MGISFKQKGNFNTTLVYMDKLKKGIHTSTLIKWAKIGCDRLREYTPKRTGLTSESWTYSVERTRTGASISFYNSNIQNGVPIAIVIQLGHATRNGSWVEGVDYINPALKFVFEQLAADIWEEVKTV